MKHLLAITCLLLTGHPSKPQTNYAAYVNPLVGTDGHGHTFPGATVPFGMVQVSPDTRVDGSWDGCSGYHYSDTLLYGFSHTHLSGTGVSDYGDIPLMPMMDRVSFEQKEYATAFSHADETAKAGYYALKLGNGINVELTATTRVGFHRYQFPKKGGSIVIDLTHRDELLEGDIRVVDNKTLAVKRRSRAWATDQHAYAHIVFSSPFKYRFNEAKTKIILDFALKAKEPLLVKVGYSLVDVDGARKNMSIELPGWDFVQTRKAAEAAWNKELGRIEVTSTDQEKMRVFYTAFYHTMIHPNVANDVDGRYRGMNGEVGKVEGFTYYTVFSLWDTFRAAHPLFALIDSKRTLDFIKTFLRQYSDGGRLPVWELAGNETDCMIGYHSVSVMADALAKGIDGFDVAMALEAMKKSATWDHLGLPEYRRYGFLSIDDEHESVSKTLEYAYDDWCIAQVAKRLDKEEDYHTYMLRSHAWKNLLDPETKLMRPRKNGGWLKPFDPREVNNHFTEGNAWQYSFFVPQDIPGMIRAMGGPAAFEDKLDELFSTTSQTTGRSQADITGLIGQYAHGNEPSHHMAYLYNYIGKPEKTREMVHRILRSFYTSRPDGLIGNEDCGQMSAWYVLSSLGLYAVTPGSDQYTLTQPIMDDFIVHLGNGKTITRKTIADALEEGLFISHHALIGEGSPLKEVGISDLTYVPAPVVEASSHTFVDSMQVRFLSTENDPVVFEISGRPGKHMSGAVYIHESCTVSAKAVRRLGDKTVESKTVHARFFKNPHPHWGVQLGSTYNPQYSAGGPGGLIDGVTGTENWRKGDWQGYQGQDFEAVIALNEEKDISHISGRFLQDTRSWILMPVRVEYYVSMDGEVYTLLGTVANTVDPKDYAVQVRPFAHDMAAPIRAKFVKVKAYNFGALPVWHQGAGYPAFIFVDEVGIE